MCKTGKLQAVSCHVQQNLVTPPSKAHSSGQLQRWRRPGHRLRPPSGCVEVVKPVRVWPSERCLGHWDVTYGSLNENGPYRLKDLNTWSEVGGIVWHCWRRCVYGDGL